MTLMQQMDEIITLAHRRGIHHLPGISRMLRPVVFSISTECNKGKHFDCSGCTCQCHGGSPGWAT